MAVRHGVIDTDKRFVIDPVTRTIKNESDKLTLIQYDHNSERFTFEIPRYIDKHDMSLCNRVEIHYINIGKGKDKKNGLYLVDDLQVSADNENVVTCTWLISQNATQLVGTLNFIVRFECIDDEGISNYTWSTAIYQGISISSGIYNGDIIIEEYADILEQWRHDLYAEGKKIRSVEQTVTSTEDGGVNVVTMAMSDDSTFSFEVRNGSKGSDYALTSEDKEEIVDGIKIRSVEQITISTEDGGVNVIQVTTADDSTFSFEVRNGSKGLNGSPGVSIRSIERVSGSGNPGETDTYRITLTDDNFTEFQVYNGANGTSYVLTDEDKMDIARSVLTLIPSAEGNEF